MAEVSEQLREASSIKDEPDAHTESMTWMRLAESYDSTSASDCIALETQ